MYNYYPERVDALIDGKTVYSIGEDKKSAFRFFLEGYRIKSFVKRDNCLESEINFYGDEEPSWTIFWGETISQEEYETWGIKTPDSSYEQ